MSSQARRVALVTGGAKRVGRAIVQKLAREGFDVAFTYFRAEPLARDLEHDILSTTGRRGIAIFADLSDPEEATRRIFDEFTSHFARLDALVKFFHARMAR